MSIYIDSLIDISKTAYGLRTSARLPLSMAHRLSRFDNRPSGLMDRNQACDRLGVKPATLYTYVSRGLIRSVPGVDRRQRHYVRQDVERVAQRAEARRGHRAVAVGALGFGEPVLDTEITSTSPRLAYRGHDVVQLARDNRPFEQVAALLWQAEPEKAWPPVPRGLWRARTKAADSVMALSQLILRQSMADSDRAQPTWQPDHERAQRILRAFACGIGPKPGPCAHEEPIAQTVSQRLGLPTESHPAVNAALILVADHELNISSFAARVAASGGADLYACIGAALYVFSGPRHGGAPARIDAVVREAGSARQAPARIRARLARGDAVPGFGHPLYPKGDPRSPPLLAWAQRLAKGRQPRLRTLLKVAEVMGPEQMTVDGALLALAYALDLQPQDASAIFCVGRTAGWAAHVFEQRQSRALLRPRARYIGE